MVCRIADNPALEALRVRLDVDKHCHSQRIDCIHRLPRADVPSYYGVSGAFMGVESYIRLNQSEGQRHVRVQQFLLNGVGVGGALLMIVLYFGLKALERWLLTESRLPRSSPRDPSGSSVVPPCEGVFDEALRRYPFACRRGRALKRRGGQN